MSEKDEEKTKLGEQIRQLRKKKGLTIEELADKVGITKGYLSHIETGTVDSPSLKVIRKVAKNLNVDISKVLDPKEEGDSSGIYYGYHNIFDELNNEKKKNQRKYKQAITLVGDILADESIPEEKRKEIAEEITSLVERIKLWLK